MFYWTSELNIASRAAFFTITVFQSLFYWTSELNLETRKKILEEIQVSILVLLDFGIKRFYACHFLLLSKMFQSLFYWTSELNPREVQLLGARSLCFNPCFIGLRN